MFNLSSTLDTVIAMVVVILVLSLLVQAIQGFIKKIFKLKSKEIEKSLVELFKNIIDKPAPSPAAPAGNTPPAPGTDQDNAKKTDGNDIEAHELYKRVLLGFKSIGRYTKWGRPILESISKEDLLKILAREDSKHFYADYATKFAGIYDQVKALENAIGDLIKNNQLRGAASAKFAEMQEALAPLINDIKSLLSGETIKATVFLGDLINLRNIKLADVLSLLSQAQESVAKDLQAERQANNTTAVTALETLSTKLTEIAGIISQLGQKADLAFATLRAKLDHVELWYDTVMQSFEERYIRHMKNVSIYISIAVVVFINASLFRVYRSIATNDQQRELIVKAGEQWLEKRGEKGEPAKAKTTNTVTNTSANGNSDSSANVNANSSTNANSNVNSNLNGSTPDSGGNVNGNSNPAPTLNDLKKDIEEIKTYAGTFEDFGFSPLTLNQAGLWWDSFFNRGMFVTRDWWIARRGDLAHAFGWFFMVLLLSVGAPFWQDTLESLFGIKNLLRKKSGTKNVEEGSGQGQPRT